MHRHYSDSYFSFCSVLFGEKSQYSVHKSQLKKKKKKRVVCVEGVTEFKRSEPDSNQDSCLPAERFYYLVQPPAIDACELAC